MSPRVRAALALALALGLALLAGAVDAREARADVTAPVVACHRFHFG